LKPEAVIAKLQPEIANNSHSAQTIAQAAVAYLRNFFTRRRMRALIGNAQDADIALTTPPANGWGQPKFSKTCLVV